MKTTLLLRLLPIGLLALPLSPALAQTAGVGIGTTTPDASAALDIASSSKGLLLPRITEAARMAMGTGAVPPPAAGLVVYQTDGAQPGFWYASSPTAWVRLTDQSTANGQFIQNQTAADQAANFRISGNGALGGNLGVGVPAPAYKLDVAGSIHAATSQGVVLDAQDRPLITRGWDPFTSGTNVGLGRWGLFMEPLNLTFGVPVMANRQFQWATYNLDSSVGSQLMVLNQAGNLGLGVPAPAYKLDVNGAIHATTDQGILLNAQDRPLITRGWDAFTSGSYNGVGRWGLFMEVNRLTFGVPVQANDGFQWATYNANSTVGSTLMTLSQEGRLGIGNPAPNYPLDVAGAIHAATDKGLVLDAQDRPLITRGWDTFATGNYTGLGRWGLFMEPSSLTFGIPMTNATTKRFQWATYKDDSSIEQQLMSLYSNGYLGIGNFGAALPGTRVDIVSEAGGPADDVLLRSYGAGSNPGLGIRRYRGTLAAPANLQAGDVLGDVGLSGYYNGQQNLFNQSGMRGYYRGDGLTGLSDLKLVTSGQERVTVDAAGQVGIGQLTPAYPLDVNGAIHAATNQGVVLDAQDRPLITRGWDAFTSGNYNGLGRWGLFMEINNLTFGVPAVAGKQFQWVNYNADSNISSQLMALSQAGNLGVGIPAPAASVEVTRGTGVNGTAAFHGTTRISHFNYNVNEDTYIRGGKATSNVYLNDNGGGVAIGAAGVTAGELLDVNGTTRTTEVHTPATGTANMLALAYGQVTSTGASIANSSGNVTVSRLATGHYRLTFTGLGGISFDAQPVALSLNGAAAGFISSEGLTGGPGTLDVYCYTTNGNTLVDRNFNFTVFKP